MPVTKKTYFLNKIKQLIDLNGDITNFDLTFTATSKDGSSFNLLVVNQTTLDSSEPLNYKTAEGTISGNIISDKGIYQNYFLLLKSDAPCECDVTIDIKEIPKASPTLSEQNKLPVTQSSISSNFQTINWKYLIIFILIIGGVTLLYFMYKKVPNKTIEYVPISTENINSLKNSIETKSVNESLLERLNNITL
jgi:hypothetical protein